MIDLDPPPLGERDVHVWRVALDDDDAARALRPVLSAEERARADRFYTPLHGRRFAVAHGWKRRVLAHYAATTPAELRFGVGPHGKPSLCDAEVAGLHFNLSHSNAIALVAVSRGGPLGVDVECWDRDVAHLALAERFFSAAEREALRALAGDEAAVTAGFFAAWSRKEAYLKATGHGITRGLHHFDVTLTPGAPAALLADRLDPDATTRWTLRSLDVAPGYSAALVAEAPVGRITVLDARGE